MPLALRGPAAAVALSAGVLVAIPAVPAYASAAATPSCTSGYETVQNYAFGGWLYYNRSTKKITTVAKSPTNWCLHVTGPGLTEFQQADTSQCITYHSGGYFDETTCAAPGAKSDQTFSAGSGEWGWNYLISNGAMNDPGLGDALNVYIGNAATEATATWNEGP